MIKKTLLTGALIALTACEFAPPTIDASTDETMRASVEKITGTLPTEKAKQFTEAITTVSMSNLNLDLGMLINNPELAKQQGGNQIKQSLNGKTADQIIQEAERIISERKAKERTQALAEITELNQKIEAATQAKSELAKFKVLKSRFFTEDAGYGRKQPIIELTVKNDTAHPISRAYFVGTIASPNRTVPWLSENFNYAIDGGLEPGETAEWRMGPNMFSKWGKVDAPADTIFTVITTKLDGANNQTLFDAKISESDITRLAALKEKYPN